MRRIGWAHRATRLVFPRQEFQKLNIGARVIKRLVSQIAVPLVAQAVPLLLHRQISNRRTFPQFSLVKLHAPARRAILPTRSRILVGKWLHRGSPSVISTSPAGFRLPPMRADPITVLPCLNKPSHRIEAFFIFQGIKVDGDVEFHVRPSKRLGKLWIVSRQ